VDAVYPATESVPANLLRFYVHFSGPMRTRDVDRFVRIERADGTPVETAFVDIPEGLWDPGSRRLTLFIHPGRIKRGVGLGDELGPVLDAGERYRLVVGGGMLDAEGRPIETEFVHRFVAAPVDRVPPDPSQWQVASPSTERGVLTVRFGESLDRALLARMVEVHGADAETIAGQMEISVDGESLLFRPDDDWREGDYVLVVRPELEDLAGNRPGAPFDRALAIDRRQASGGGRDREIPFAFPPNAGLSPRENSPVP